MEWFAVGFGWRTPVPCEGIMKIVRAFDSWTVIVAAAGVVCRS
jgi:hypothetical protein